MENRKKIFVLTENDVANKYGIKTYVNQLIKSLVDLYDIYVITLYAEGDKFMHNKREHINYIYLPWISCLTGNSLSKTWQARYYTRVAYIILSFLETEDEHIYIHFNAADRILLSKLQVCIPKASYLYTVHYVFWKSYQLSYKKILQIIYSPSTEEEKKIEEKVKDEIAFMQQCDIVISLSPETTDILKGIYKISTSIREMPNGNDDLYDTAITQNKDVLKKKFGFQAEDKIIIFVGRIIPNKGVLELVQAYKNITSTYPHVKLIMVGDGCFDLCLREISPLFSKITFTGFIEHDLLKELYLISDIGILPSHFEECSCTIIEMMSVQLAIIASDIPSFDMLKESQCAIVVPTGNAEKIKEAIEKLLIDGQLRRKIAQNARQKYLCNYTFEIFKKNISIIYHEV